MEIYTVEFITEADYGCEETGRKEPMALVGLSSDEGKKSIEVSEAEISRQGIREGKKVVLIEDDHGKAISEVLEGWKD
ncbi:MAG: hypothetical protein IJ796_08850 [Lachnospiraceae bacterium]|nr:hypothetical protein [Lachnospiraceae bacterium]